MLVELTSPNPRQNLLALLSTELQQAAMNGMVRDALIATSIAQSLAMWKLRESVPEAQRLHGANLKHDISVPVSLIPQLIEDGSALVQRLAPEGEVIGYGHLGDGNLHFNVASAPAPTRRLSWSAAEQLEHAIFDLVDSSGRQHQRGARYRAAESGRIRGRADPVELAVMRDLKRALDPRGILNPGKVLA